MMIDKPAFQGFEFECSREQAAFVVMQMDCLERDGQSGMHRINYKSGGRSGWFWLNEGTLTWEQIRPL